MVVTLKAYLARLEAQEQARPPERRRHIPTLTELADAVGIHQVTMTKIASSKIEHLNLRTGGRIIDELRRRGFAVEVSDIIVYQPAEDA